MDEDRALAYFEQICKGVAALHRQSIIHRDIKLQNIIVFPDDQVKIADFGVSKKMNELLSMVETMVGTPVYMAPEQCAGKPYNQKVDIWGLGCLLYEMLTGRKPFEGKFLNVISEGGGVPDHQRGAKCTVPRVQPRGQLADPGMSPEGPCVETLH